MKKLATIFVLLLFLVSCNDKTNSNDHKCVEPQNPYEEDSGHYAGFDWALENNGNCDGNSDSFNEGCEEYYRQLDEYNKCISEN